MTTRRSLGRLSTTWHRPPETAVFCRRFSAVAGLAKRHPVTLFPKQGLVPLVWDHVVNFRRLDIEAQLLAMHAQRVLVQMNLPSPLPPPPVAALRRRATRRRVEPNRRTTGHKPHRLRGHDGAVWPIGNPDARFILERS